MNGTAVSVVRGRTLSTFNAEVLGILRDAVGPGRDIIIANLSGPAVDGQAGSGPGRRGRRSTSGAGAWTSSPARSRTAWPAEDRRSQA
jgi:hypothetical protein